MSAHSAHSWNHPNLNLTTHVTRAVCYHRVNRRGKRARRLAWARYWNAITRNLPARLPVWMCGPKPLPIGPCGSVPKPSSKVEEDINHGGTVRKGLATCH
jgi:hypothetical protein